MMPPNCCLCDKGHEAGDACELICFARTEGDREWHLRASSEEGFTGHPPDCDWFCETHVETAKALAHRNCASALLHIQKNESWHLIYIDLFDRDTPPLVHATGMGLESGFLKFWDEMLATVETDGRRYPTDFRLSFSSETADYSLPRACPELTTIKQHMPSGEQGLETLKQLAFGHARQMRSSGLSGATQYLTHRCRQLAEKQE